MRARTRKALGCAGLLIYLGVYAALAARMGATLVGAAPAWAQLIFYALAGTIWVVPLKPLFGWMNRGA